ncbi:MAG: hypothetical protein KDB10_21765, partial [Acidimicrobiales bacterium]|nr:hypothetical protein [Acidimicrobiales bacterium]
MATTRRWSVALGMVAMALLVGAGLAGPAAAQGTDDGDAPPCTDVVEVEVQLIVRGGPLVVESCTTTDAVVVGDADVLVDRDATVDGPVVVVNGTAVIRGLVTGDVVVLRGRAVIERTAHVEGDVVSSQQPRVSDRAEVDGSTERVQFTAILNGIGIAARIAWWVAISVSTLVAGLIFAGAFGGVARRTVQVARDAVAPAIGTGGIAALGVPLVSGLLLFTIVATPLGLVGLASMAPLYLLGFVAGATVLGHLILRERTGLVWAFLLGWLILRVLGILPFLGGLLTFAATVYGLGALLVAAWQLTRAVAPALSDPGPAADGAPAAPVAAGTAPAPADTSSDAAASDAAVPD